MNESLQFPIKPFKRSTTPEFRGLEKKTEREMGRQCINMYWGVPPDLKS